MPSPLFPIIIAAGTAWVGSFFKNTDAKLIRKRQHRDTELKKAETIYNEISNYLDTIYYYQHDVAIYVAVRNGKNEPRNPHDLEDWRAYDKALTTWRANESRLIAEHTAYFGSEYHDALLDISRAIKKGEKIIGATYYQQNSEYDILSQVRVWHIYWRQRRNQAHCIGYESEAIQRVSRAFDKTIGLFKKKYYSSLFYKFFGVVLTLREFLD